MKKIIHHDAFISVVFLLFSAFMLFETFSLPAKTAKYPTAVIVGMLLFAAVTLYQALVATRNIDETTAEKAQYLKLHIVRRPLITALLVFAYTLCMDFVGFFTATALFLVAFMYYCGMKKWKVVLYSVIGMNLFIYLMFVLQLKIQFPQAWWF